MPQAFSAATRDRAVRSAIHAFTPLARCPADSVKDATRLVDRSLPLPAECSAWERPVYGYTGTIHCERVDVELVAAISETLERGTLVFVGPNHLPAEFVARLTSRGNVHFTGPLPYQRIADYMRAFDVCMVPHLVSPFTESLNPIKLWEYLAAGKPIVSTPVAGFRDYPHLVRLAATADEFAAALTAAPLEDKTQPDARRAEAARHSWSSRVDQIEAVIDQSIERRRAARLRRIPMSMTRRDKLSESTPP